MQEAVDAHDALGSVKAVSDRLGIPYRTAQTRLRRAREENVTPSGFAADPLPDDDPPVEALIERRQAEFARRKARKDAAKLRRVRVKVAGPFGICHWGDPHVDDPGCDIDDIKRHISVINATEGLMAANVGDMSNNWVGRLQRLYAQQETTKKQAWKLVEWMVGAVPWLYLIAGNHDCWSGDDDPIRWMRQTAEGSGYTAHGARLELNLPNGRRVRINARHDFRGNSQYNTVHGPAKAAKFGMRDHILTCGHLHISGYMPIKCPATGLISHCMRVAGFKVYDSYADELGAPDHRFGSSMTTIINPDRDEDDADMVHVYHDVEEAAEYLTWLRGRKVA